MHTYGVQVMNISTHTLTWSVTFKPTTRIITVKNFNSHAHVERDFITILRTIGVVISTHTLTWSVTYSNSNNEHSSRISTHTLTWSVT